MKKDGTAPAGMILEVCETIVAVRAIISEIPTINRVLVDKSQMDDGIWIDEGEIYLEEKSRC